MTQTQNYKLNQWESSDRLLMEDFNADNAKVDAALASVAAAAAAKADASALQTATDRIALLETNRATHAALAAEATAREQADAALRSENCWVKLGSWTTSGTSVTLPVSGAGNYRELKLVYQCTVGGSTSSMYLKLNNLSDANTYGYQSSTTASTTNVDKSSFSLLSSSSGRCAGEVALRPLGGGATALFSHLVSRIGTNANFRSLINLGVCTAVELQNVTSLVLSCSNGLSECKWTLYGLKG